MNERISKKHIMLNAETLKDFDACQLKAFLDYKNIPVVDSLAKADNDAIYKEIARMRDETAEFKRFVIGSSGKIFQAHLEYNALGARLLNVEDAVLETKTYFNNFVNRKLPSLKYMLNSVWGSYEKHLYCVVDALLARSDNSVCVYLVSPLQQEQAIAENMDNLKAQVYLLRLNGVDVKEAKICCSRMGNDEKRVVGNRVQWTDNLLDKSFDQHELENYFAPKIAAACEVLEDAFEPLPNYGKHCEHCPRWKTCSARLPADSVLNLYNFPDKWRLYNEGVTTYDQVLMSDAKLSKCNLMQIKAQRENRDILINADSVKSLFKFYAPTYVLTLQTQKGVVCADTYCGELSEPTFFEYARYTPDSPDSPVDRCCSSDTDTPRDVANKMITTIWEKQNCGEDDYDVVVYDGHEMFEAMRDISDVYDDCLETRCICEHAIDIKRYLEKGDIVLPAMRDDFSWASFVCALFGDSTGITMDDVLQKLREIYREISEK